MLVLAHATLLLLLLTPTIYYTTSISRIRGAGYVVEYNMATVKTPAQRAKHVKLVQIVYYYC